jgi:ElaB/YqjD/DUF883 family membrane-anchored ribosome-binding protein
MADPNEPGPQEEDAEMADDPISEGVAAARERFQRLSEDVTDRARKVTDDARRGVDRAAHEIRRGAERAREAYDEVSHRARQTYRKVRSQARDATYEVNRFVKDNPGKSILIAAGVGFLIGLLVGRRRRDDE